MRFNKVPCKIIKYSNDNNSNLMKVKLYIMHDGKNFNQSSFTYPSMINAEETIKNIPILAYVLKDEEGNIEDFDGHNMVEEIVKEGNSYKLKTTYLETPVGLIPESCNPRYEQINDKIYFCVDGYIWKSYSNGSYKLIEDNEFKGVSMEISIQDGNYNLEDDVYEIKKYTYEGVTILGDNVPPAMEDCRVMKYSSSNQFKEVLENIYKEIYKLEEEVHNVDENVKVEETVEEKPQSTEEFSEEVVQTETTEPIENTEEFEVTEVEEKKETQVEEFKEDEKEEEEDDFKKKKKCSQSEFSLECFNVFFETVPETVEEVCSLLVEKFEVINKELDTLKDFKKNYDKELLKSEVEKIISEFSFEEEEIKEVREKSFNGEMTIDELKKELFALEGMKIHQEKKQFSSEEVKSSAKIVVSNSVKEYEPYGDLFKKYGNK